MKRRKTVIDDVSTHELVSGARFDGALEIPVIEPPSRIIIPDFFVPFSQRKRADSDISAVCFYEHDTCFYEILADPEKYIDELKQFQAVISPDCSMYRDAPLAVQITNLYRSRAIGSFWQRRGVNIIPNIRWGSKDTYTNSVLPEKIAFLGAPKHSIVAIGTYGCIRHREDKYHFKAGLDAMLETLEPEVVLVYGAMPESVFGAYRMYTTFVRYDNWTKIRHKGGI